MNDARILLPVVGTIARAVRVTLNLLSVQIYMGFCAYASSKGRGHKGGSLKGQAPLR